MTYSEPLVSVVIPVYNGEKYISQAVESILGQSLTDLELILINDGSTDNSLGILEEFQRQDERVRLYSQENLGIVRSLNTGIDLARGRYLARLDADDFSLTERLEKQAAVLERKPEFVLVGSSYFLFSEAGNTERIVEPPFSDTGIRCALLFDNPFAQSSVMMRLDTLQKNQIRYDQNFPLSEDYDLWSRLLEFGMGLNLNKPLCFRRIHSQQVSEVSRQECIARAEFIAQRNLHNLGFEISLDSVRILRSWFHGRLFIRNQEEEQLIRLLFEIFEKLSQDSKLNQSEVNLFRARFVLRLLFANAPGRQNLFRKFGSFHYINKSDFFYIIEYILKQKIPFIHERRWNPQGLQES